MKYIKNILHFKSMNSLPSGTIIKDKEDIRWIILTSNENRRYEKITEKDSQNYGVYEIHDNGGRPFDVIVSVDKVFILANDDTGREPQHILTIKDYSRIFIEKDPEMPGSEGNSILIQVKDLDYLYIGSEIYRFQTERPILEYYSPVGNSDVPYPYAVTRDKTYLMIEGKVINNNDLTQDDPYDDAVMGISFKYEVIYGRSDSTASFFNIWKEATAPYRT